MINILEISDACINILGVLFFIKELGKVVFFLIPIFLIVIITLDFLRGVITFDSSKEKVMNYVVKRIVYTLIVFLIPASIFGVLKVIGIVVTDSESCWAYVDEKSIETIKSQIATKQKAIETHTEKLINEIAKSNSLLMKDKERNRTIVETNSSKTDNNEEDNSTSNDNSTSTSEKITLDWSDLTKTSNLSSSADLKKALKKTKNLKKFATYSDALYKAEQDNKVNVFFLIGLEAHESDKMNSSIAKDCNNLGGVKGNNCPGHQYRKFNSKEDFIKYHGKLLGKSYLKKGSSLYRGKTLASIVKNYCGDCPDWISETKKFGNEVYRKAKSG